MTHPLETINRMCTSLESFIFCLSALTLVLHMTVRLCSAHIRIDGLMNHIQQLSPRTAHIHICLISITTITTIITQVSAGTSLTHCLGTLKQPIQMVSCELDHPLLRPYPFPDTITKHEG
jgi:hypothetical protein